MANDEIEKAESDITKAIYISVPLIIFGVLAPILSYYSVFIPEDEKRAVWFQRSGSLSVLFGVWIEYNLSKVNEHINLSGLWVTEQETLRDEYNLKYSIVQYVGIFLAVMGTLIWGYGDILISK